MHYYETAHYEPGATYPTVVSHATIDEAIDFANAHNCTIISEIGGYWTEFEKCDFCHDWFNISDLKDGLCEDCERAIEEHAAEERKSIEERTRQRYRIRQIGFSYEVQNYGLYILDGWAEEDWHTVKTFWDEDEARQYIERRVKSLT